MADPETAVHTAAADGLNGENGISAETPNCTVSAKNIFTGFI